MLLRTLPLLDNFEHKVITLKEPGELAPRFISAGIPVDVARCHHLLNIPGAFRLRKLIREENPDVILTYLFHADIIGRLGLRHTTNAPIIPFLRTTYNHPKYLIARISEWLTKPLVKRYLANSEAVKDFYIRNIGVHPEKITVIPNGIDVGYFDSIIPDQKLRESLGIKSSDFVIICVANLHINKGHRYLLEAFENVFKKHQNTRLLLVGDGTERNNLEKQTQGYASKNNISFLGRRVDVPQLLKISDLFILPTLFEGQSNAIMEAMTSGLPIITTDIPENKILIENNIDGLLVPIRNSLAIIQAVDQIKGNGELKKQLSIRSKETVSNSFSLEKISIKWQNVLIEMIK